ncbi:enoyl-CoA hydratase-related protein [Rossellomorea sp. RS05]|jgi:enoyl-CoA hydratase|uniref:enoyl-CoA hydratase/isomerase family protein n=1 Tax=Rossellomorea sp. RS05 TaxID=3149166 RepID=UPI003221EA69
MGQSDEFITVRVEDAIGIVELNRPDVLNALNRQMVSEVVGAFERLDRDGSVKVILLMGKGRAFAAGADIKEMADAGPVDFELMDPFAPWDRMTLIKKPIIGAVHGFALGGGFELALSCDLLFAAEDARFGFPEVNLGVMPGAGGTQRLTKLLGKTRAMEWLLSGDTFSAEEALQWGIVNRTIPQSLLIEETKRFARKLADKPPLSLRLIKESVHTAVDATVSEGMKQERKNFYLLFASEDQKEGMKAFVEKRTAEFKGR